MRRWIAAVLAAAVALCAAGCVRRAAQTPEGATLAVYCAAVPEEAQGGDILTGVRVSWADQARLPAQMQAQSAVELLLGACQAEGFTSPLPAGTRLLSCSVTGSTAVVDFSEEYGQLTGMNRTIADYCVALTLTQIEPIRMVRILVNGQQRALPHGGTILAGDALLTSTEDVVRSFAARLYFRGAEGELVGEDRLLTLYEGESRGAVILSALLARPETAELETVLPPDFAALSFRTEDGVCVMNLPASDEELLPEDPDEQDLLVRSVVRSLCSIDGVDAVQILIDGEMRGTFGAVDISQPLTDEPPETTED